MKIDEEIIKKCMELDDWDEDGFYIGEDKDADMDDDNPDKE